MMNQKKCPNGRQFMEWIHWWGALMVVSASLDDSDLKKPLRKAFQVFFLPIMLVFSIAFFSNGAGAADVKLTPQISCRRRL